MTISWFELRVVTMHPAACACAGWALLNAELDVLDARGDLVHDLLLDSVVGRRVGHGGG